MRNQKSGKPPQGFSLVELLVVIAVIGVIAAVAIPAMSGIFGESETAKAKRNAQQIASVFSAAQNAGNTTAYADKNAAVTAVTQGSGMAGRGAFSNSIFQAPMSTTEADLAKPYLAYAESTASLKYLAAGGEAVTASPTDTNPNEWQDGPHYDSAEQVQAELPSLNNASAFEWRANPSNPNQVQYRFRF